MCLVDYIATDIFFLFMIDLLPALHVQCTRDIVWQLVPDAGIAHLVSSPFLYGIWPASSGTVPYSFRYTCWGILRAWGWLSQYTGPTALRGIRETGDTQSSNVESQVFTPYKFYCTGRGSNHQPSHSRPTCYCSATQLSDLHVQTYYRLTCTLNLL